MKCSWENHQIVTTERGLANKMGVHLQVARQYIRVLLAVGLASMRTTEEKGKTVQLFTLPVTVTIDLTKEGSDGRKRPTAVGRDTAAAEGSDM